MSKPDDITEAGPNLAPYKRWGELGYPYSYFGFHGVMKTTSDADPPEPFYDNRASHFDHKHAYGFLVEAPFGVPFVEMRIPYSAGQVRGEIWILAPDEDDDRLAIVVGLDGVKDAEGARELAQGLASNTVSRLCVELDGYPFGPAEPRWTALPKGRVQISDVAKFALVMPALDRPGFERLHDQLTDTIRPDDDPRQDIMRSAMSDTDPLSGFLSLYSLLLVEAGEEQKDLDHLLIKHIPETKRERFMRNGKERNETPFTRLRNDVLHPESPTPIEALRRRAFPMRAELFKVCARVFPGLSEPAAAPSPRE